MVPREGTRRVPVQTQYSAYRPRTGRTDLATSRPLASDSARSYYIRYDRRPPAILKVPNN